MSRVLGLDIGDVRIGVSMSDKLGIIASPLEVINRKKINSKDRIADIVKENDVEKIIYGLPISLDGSEKIQAKKVKKYIKELKKIINIEYEAVDERYSTVSADNMLNTFTKKDAMEKRKIVDKVAATIILQTYLDMNNKRRLQ
ncbi:MAG: Holliday junction resolvase RuvX [Fusobacteria bacterium]|nr:Holliday junction resolvase RuvX [Fusobacteriota bacterium]